MADANPTTKPLRICYTCEWWEPHELYADKLPMPILGVDPAYPGSPVKVIEPVRELHSIGICTRFPPVFCYSAEVEKSFADINDQRDCADNPGESFYSYSQSRTVGNRRCGEWKLREGLVLTSVKGDPE